MTGQRPLGRQSWGPYHARPEPPTLTQGLPPYGPPPKPPWYRPRDWRDFAWACWGIAGIALAVLAGIGAVMLAEVVFAFAQYAWGW